MTTMTADDLADSISRGEKWKVIGCIGHDCEECQTRIAKDASRQAEPVEPVPAAIVATQSDVWRGYNGQWAPPGEPIKMVQMLRDLPMGTLLYTALAQQANHLTIERLRDALVASRIIDPAAVEDPDGYDDGVTLHRIEALHRRLT